MLVESFIFLFFCIPIFCFDDLSSGHQAQQFETWACVSSTCHLYQAQNAVDGDIQTCMRTSTLEIMSSNKSKHYTWWYVDLGNIKSVYNIRIQFKDYGATYENRQKGRFAGFSLFLSNSTRKEEGQQCYINGPELPPLDFNTTCIGHGRYIIYHNERLPGKTYPQGYEVNSVTELCEVKVQGCSTQGQYGVNCSLKCSGNCQESRCSILSGACLGCRDGWLGPYCEKKCQERYYGPGCKSRCVGHCKNNETCNHVTGLCTEGCGAGWTGQLCNEACVTGRFGNNCMQKCSEHCLNGEPCNRFTGNCNGGCAVGYYGIRCDTVCPSGFFGVNCAQKCNTNCRNESDCNPFSGHCTSGCKVGYMGSFCNDVCSKGFYGQNCSRRCSSACMNSSCDHQSGQCKNGCKPGFTGYNCSQACLPGSFGAGCLHYCSNHCKNNDTCQHVDGSCRNGCSRGYRGSQCTLPCKPGFYGLNCLTGCSGKCLETCYHVDGTCLCKEGWKGSPLCNTECPPGKYGVNCGHTCSGNCADGDICNNVNGSCARGCKERFTGDNCNECEVGYYGERCCHECTGNCAFNDTCNQTDGSCPRGCSVDFTGNKCGQMRLDSKMGFPLQICNSLNQCNMMVNVSIVVTVIILLSILVSVLIRKTKKHQRKPDYEKYEETMGSPSHELTDNIIDECHGYQEIEIKTNNAYEPIFYENKKR
ncbi:multiple epidermal growth factor-like domains protein 10 isoform X1 [Saccostrea cucullata]|uniref:multiple epidermal growth factor-like domains protein 10 isoform X1 n=1 Tax=Saccostrea cuccullata TaxID=36930 RepID=UPI002ED3FA20